ncbi:aminotransferase class V-fold PLP-dependent enzyme [Aliarcobacter butzleri]|uniref:aminotransferase class V-fold PLP-dependent enzyme n=1 Tax=Aliarcobacter butzleri TaxID=28197 RepID=UPI0021B3D254|nr:cysteine desulfurase [Aliarcobacter butzleri]MCT7550315.1 cysteine desulfurase [Aliarcobacter butzleri]MCT7552573.1 cysteine desulfurase [Aliarcobacter butzleri]MCT7559432.1 cysteine desulfurase [Aliarcobacter butzleri]MCT7577588.1 cysteine desulfurase [Aliarcobacter butzleri]MCT7630479.1 cysteine desulfurase [Aliarcobacter butzleri]
MFKNDFPYFQNSKTTYLDNGATTQKPKSVIDSQVEYYEHYCSNTHRSNFGDANKATLEFEKTRKILKEFINASKKEEIIFTKGVTESLNFIATSFAKDFKTVIISSLEHHSNIVPWHMQGRTLGLGLEVVNCDDNLNFDMNHFEELLKANPNAFVSITHISNAFGKIHDIEAIIKLAHSYCAVVMVDGAQSLAHTSIDVQALDVDFFAISGHKTFAPTGVGAIYIKEKYLKDVKPYQTGGATIHEVDFSGSTLLDSPYKFEAGTQNIAGVIGFGKALEYLNYVKYENIQSIEHNVFKYLDEELAKLPDIVFYNDLENCVGSRSFNFKGIVHDDIGILLDKMKVAVRVGHHCAQPIMKKLGIKGTIRVSISFYNDYVDVDNLITALKKALNMLRD